MVAMRATRSEAWITFGCNSVSLVFGVLLMYRLRNSVLRRLRFGFAFQTVNLVSQVLAVVGAALAAYSEDYTEIGYNFLNFAILGLSCNSFSICMTNLEIADLYSVLDKNSLTPQRVRRLRWFFCILFPLLAGETFLDETWYAVAGYKPDWLHGLALKTDTVWVVLVVIYDNLQLYYLSRLVWRWKLRQKKSLPSQSYAQVLWINGAVVVLDWVGILLAFLNSYIFSELGIYAGINNAVMAISGIHLTLLFLAFVKLKDIAMAGHHTLLPKRLLAPTESCRETVLQDRILTLHQIPIG
ncbi:hypothetical protein HDV03_000426 [Kappamyces sp. JEL0829]|nr:hypothetical protein HDV03_000426 [Kappamyces sp. JEL0829]